jgi:hypothetical protein
MEHREHEVHLRTHLVATDAGVDLLGRSSSSLCHKLRVCKEWSRLKHATRSGANLPQQWVQRG